MSVDRCALVVGGANGIGQATAARLARLGTTGVVVADRDEAAARATVASLGLPDGHALALTIDVASTESVESTMEQVLDRFGRLDTLVVTAGITDPGPVVELTDERFAKLLDIHLTGTLRCVRAAYPALSRSPAASVVTLTSPASQMGIPGRASYAAAKAGVEGLTRVLAVEWAEAGIRVNAVSPGYTRTPLLAELIRSGAADEQRMRARVPLGRLAEPDDIAAVIVFLTGPDARYVTGQVVYVDGGLFINGNR